MRSVIVVLGLILLSSFVSAVEFSCSKDSDCLLATGDDVRCINSVCMEQRDVDVVPPLSVFQKRDAFVAWDPLVVREGPRPLRAGECPGCFRFAPETESSFEAFWRFIAYA